MKRISPVNISYKDIPFMLMGVLCVLSAAGEYVYPVEPRTVPKAIFGAQIILSFMSVLIISYDRQRFVQLNFKQPIVVAISLFFFWIMGVGFVFSGTPSDMIDLGLICIFWYSMFVFFYVTIQMYPDGFKYFSGSLLISLVILLFALNNSMNVNSLLLGRSVDNPLQNYLSYNLVVILPFIFLFKNKPLKYVALLLCLISCLISMKRGAFVTFALMCLIISIVRLFIEKKNEKGKIIAGVLLFWIVIVLGVYIYYVNHQQQLEHRLEDTTGSGRLDLYSDCINEIMDFDGVDVIVGKGANSFAQKSGLPPHNDFLLLTHDYGFLSLFIMLSIYFILSRDLYLLLRIRSSLVIPFGMAIIGIVCMQLFSYGIFMTNFGYLLGAIGCIYGVMNKQNMAIQSHCR